MQIYKPLNSPAIQVKYMTKRDKLYSLIKEHGILNSAWVVIKYILQKTIGLDWGTEILIKRSLDEPIQEIAPRIKVRIEQAYEDDLDKFKGIVDENQYNQFQQRFKAGNICFVASDGEKVVAYSWISYEFESKWDSQVKTKLKEGEVYLYNYYVSNDYRRAGIYTCMIAKVCAHLHHKGYHTAYAFIVSSNIPARKLLSRVGFQGKQTVIPIGLLGLRFQLWGKYTGTL